MRVLGVSKYCVGLALFLCAAQLASSYCWAEDWPEFRGPNGQGIYGAKQLPLKWSKSEGVKWRTELPGNGWSSPIVVGGTIYLTAAVPVNENETL